jgi:hypothetical protein
VSPVSVSPELTSGSELALPVLPEFPPGPDVAVEFDVGLTEAFPVFPEVALPVAVEFPVLPEAATPSAVAFAAPVLPAFDVEVALPVSPDLAKAFASPWSEYEKLKAGPELPDFAVDPATESPDDAFAVGFDVALPELPVLPDETMGAAIELPDDA